MQVELCIILATIRIFVENIKRDRGRYFQMEKYRLFLLLSTHEGLAQHMVYNIAKINYRVLHRWT